MNRSAEAYAIKINGGRWFYGYDRLGRIKTAWSIAGARLWSSIVEASAACVDIDSERHHPELVTVVALVEEAQ